MMDEDRAEYLPHTPRYIRDFLITVSASQGPHTSQEFREWLNIML
jgi:hypothetical protein